MTADDDAARPRPRGGHHAAGGENFTPAEAAAMRAALTAAQRGVRGANPVVGAALVDAAGTLLHVGHHRGAGTDHAEVDVLRQARAAGTPLGDTTLLVTLEPCHHTGRTGPCSAAILAAGIPRVVFAVPDATDAARGGGAHLAAHGVDVRHGLLAEPARDLNERWFLAQRRRRPFVTLKLAQSLDGRVAAADGTSQWITGAPARAEGHALRARVDAILVGGGTLRADDPSLTARDAHGTPVERQPLRAVMSTEPVSEHARVRCGVAAGESTARSGASGDDGRFVHLATHDPAEALQALRELGAAHVLVEGGPTVSAAFLAADLVDELWLYQAPLLLGEGSASVAPLGIGTLTGASRWRSDPVGLPKGGSPVAAVGEDLRWHLRPAPRETVFPDSDLHAATFDTAATSAPAPQSPATQNSTTQDLTTQDPTTQDLAPHDPGPSHTAMPGAAQHCAAPPDPASRRAAAPGPAPAVAAAQQPPAHTVAPCGA
ncbi:bifunctional diaminohydroxyphosphoribosylaminopyrimidine deaminase/5-amino-6-(5-phosphoribosylamino)uracil reductase RibD [Kocuria salsicia]|uniref:bifunctional diaminohydroxyphosphoribosylaminopyrimidine deaminase/5-amino-6-(5-phosphoribosylamino)uracil reductase RibD n=1 Tax=Kocuria salsicia TaxID=664639 RepID=UPI000AB2BD8E|nr:bifunctional diaminohydroxyphosphoribosylaminopyrimidine deaminase/5-amino-6-(5-phosphoribosylamino)uracil reductase RibD [Kocuria salsicia]